MAKKINTEWRNRIVSSGTMPASRFVANPSNWRIHPKAQREALSGVLNEVGWVQNVIVNKTTGNVVDGHARIEEALKRGDDTPVPYVEVELTEGEEQKILLTLDPISAMAAADKANLDALLKNVETQDAAVMAMIAELADKAGLDYGDSKPLVDAEPRIDEAEELRVKWDVELGQLWQLGDHRLLCGDSTKREDVERLMGGEKADAVVTDPPYGIGVDKAMYAKGGKQYDKAAAPNRFYAKTNWDSEPPSSETIKLIVSTAKESIIWGGNYFDLPPARCYLVWDKENGETEFADCELAWTNLDKPVRLVRHLWNGMLRKDKEERGPHPTQKPLAVIVWAIGQLSNTAQIIFDAYLGSGTTLIACEQLGRKCRAIEISPAYVGVTLQRFFDATGKTPVLMTNENATNATH